MLLSSKHLTPVIGLDIHIVLLFGFPIPLPHPYIGLVIDPMDYIPVIGSSVYVNNVPRGKSDTSGLFIILFHIPMGGPFLLAPMIGHDSVNFFGSKTVKAEGNLLSPSGHFLMTCNDIGIPLSLQPGKKFKPIPSLYLPTSFSIPLPIGKPVMVGGPYVPDWAGALLNLVMSFGFGSVMKVGKAAGKKGLKAFNHALKGTMGTNKLSSKLCKMGFEPVDLVQGIVAYEGTDFEMPGPLPLRWKRSWYSDSRFEGLLGHGTHLSYDMRLQEAIAEHSIVLTLPDGRDAVFEMLYNAGDSDYHRHERLLLTRDDDRTYHLFDYANRYTYTFVKEQDSWRQFRLRSVQSKEDFRITLTYDVQGRLQFLTDSAGRRFVTALDGKGRITSVTAHHRGKQRLLIRYAYNEAGDLAEITDALGQTTYIKYERHLMRSKTDRNGQTFYWEYDGPTTGARCIHTIGDGGLLEGRLEYHPDKGFNKITNSLGQTTTYHYTPDFVITQETDPLGYSRFTEYTEYFEVYRQIDEAGNVTGYTYDERGNLTSMQQPDGSKEQFMYDEDDRLFMNVDPQQRTRVLTYNDKGLVATITESDHSVKAFRYDEQNRLISYRDQMAEPVTLHYDEDGNIDGRTSAEGRITRLFDEWGRCLLERDAQKGEESYLFDDLNRLTDVRRPDGNIVELAYDAYDHVVQLSDRNQVVNMSYTPLGRLHMREKNGSKMVFLYDTESQLVKVVNPRGEEQTFTHDRRGDVIVEKGFDDVVTRYTRDERGKIIRKDRPGNRYTEYTHDDNGRVVRISYSDGTWETFGYDRSGLLTEAINEQHTVRIVRDGMGRIKEEWQNDHKVENRYDREGRRTAIGSSLGADLHFDYDAAGQVTGIRAVSGSDSWESFLRYDDGGRETERLVPGGVQVSRSYDRNGHPARFGVTREGRNIQQLHYQWNNDRQLQQISDQLSGDTTVFGYDQQDCLAWARYGNGQYDYKVPDATGNVYRTKERIDRTYKAGGRLQKTNKAIYQYDEEGNLTEKTDREGYTWRYDWYGNGLLRRVLRPDGKEVRFEYDALGRRTAKYFDGKLTRWVWDGHKPLHEWTYDSTLKPVATVNELGLLETQPEPTPSDTLLTWVFAPGTFIPAARLSAGQQHSIITDHLGTPGMALDAAGQKSWSCRLDIYGGRRHGEGNPQLVPFRYQGQYEDAETGLYYNRFRYYAPEEGLYISADPIGIAGGQNFYAYVADVNAWIDVFGWVDIWYRALNPQDMTNLDNGNGIIPKDPTANETPFNHVLKGSEAGYGDQYISLTKERAFAERWARKSGNDVVEIDLDQLHNNKLDLTTADGRKTHLGDVSRATPGDDLHKVNKWAKGAKELLVEGAIPQAAVVNRYTPPCV